MEIVSQEDHRLLAIWAGDCAEHVLTHFESRSPCDDRPRRAIEACRAWVRGELPMAQARKAAFASHEAARDAREPEAVAAARSAGHAAATAHVATHAPHAAAYALKAVARESGAEVERAWQYDCLPEHLRAIIFAT
ncbi:putative immunity protein [Phyllobacterium sp. SB3]|uniref:putative immunity protein n=1 Tax=Phyllobacterium sp. SB3 TaxID=3156073 RepID=UPI0032AEFCC8